MKPLSINIPGEVLGIRKNSQKSPKNRFKTRTGAPALSRKHDFLCQRPPLGRDEQNRVSFLLGERRIPRQYDIENYEKDLENLARWKVSRRSLIGKIRM
jgi:hypothetical protein